MPPAGETYDFLNIAPTGVLNLGTVNGTTFISNDNGVDTTWAGTVHGVNGATSMLPTNYLLKTGNGTVTFAGLTADGGEVHINGGTAKQTTATNSIRYLSVGGDGGSGTFNISGGVLNIVGSGLPSPALQVGDFGGTGVVNQTGGAVVFGVGSSFNIGNQGGKGTYTISSGSIEFQGGFMTLGRSNGNRPTASQGVLNISGDALIDLHGTQAGALIIGNREATGTNSTTGKIVQTGGTLRIRDNSTLYLSGRASASEYDLLGGTLEIGGNALQPIYSSSLSSGGVAGTYLFKLGGGTVRVIGTDLTTVVNATLVGGTTSTIDTNGLNATWNGQFLTDGVGMGNLTKAGAGKLTLSAANTYTGATNIAGGTLALVAAGAINTSSGVALSNAGIFDITGITGISTTIKDLSGAAGTSVNIGVKGLTFGTDTALTTFNGNFVGTSGTLFKKGYGTFVFGGTSNATGNVTINQGTFVTTHSDAFTQSPNVAINGSPTEGATWDLAGAGHQTIGGLAIASGDKTHVVMTLGNGHDFIQASGILSLDGYLDIRGGDGNFTPTTTGVKIVSSTSGRNGGFDYWSDDLQFLDAVVFNSGAADVSVRFVLSGTTFASAGVTPNQKALGTAIYPLGIGNPVFNAVATRSGDAALAVLDALSGDFHATTKDLLGVDATFLAGALGERLNGLNAPNGGGGAEFASSGDGVWGQAYGHGISLADASGNAGDVAGSHYGLLGGYEGGSGNWAGGFGGGFSGASVASASRGATGTISSLDLIAYAGGDVGNNVDIRAGGTYSLNAISTARTVLGQTSVASYNARTAQVFGEVGADLGMLQPFAGANYINVSTDGFTETGGIGPLSVAASTQNLTFTTLGLRVAGDVGTGATFRGMAGWRHTFGDITPLSSMTIQGQSYTVAGVPVAVDAFVAEAGVELPVGTNFTLSTTYAGQIGANSQDHGGRVTATVKF
ncbi:MAG: autotransporter domain-containing protein [Bauldia sp.]